MRPKAGLGVGGAHICLEGWTKDGIFAALIGYLLWHPVARP